MVNMLMRTRRGRLPETGLHAMIVAYILANFYGSVEAIERPEDKSLRYITEKEMTALVKPTDKPSPGEPEPWQRSYSSGREKARSFRAQWASRAIRTRNSRYRLVPPNLQTAEDKSLTKWIAALESRSDCNAEYAVDTLSIYQIQSQALQELFPEWTFVFVPYVILPLYPPSPYDSGGLEPPFWGVLALDGSTVHAFSGGNINNPSFGYKATTDFLSFVQLEEIRIRSDEDAARFWDAYYSFKRLPLSSGKHIRVDSTSWRLNDNPAQPGEQVLEVGTDSDGKILRMKLIEPDMPKQPQKKKAPQGKAAQDQLSKLDGIVTFQEG